MQGNADLSAPRLYGVRFEQGEDVDGVLSRLADHLRSIGLTISGHIQERGEISGDCSCREMRLRDLRTGEYLTISEKRGARARGCHLDWQALTEIAQNLEAEVKSGTDVLIVNRFGRAECEGRGLRQAIEAALMLGVTVIVAHRAAYQSGWSAFQAGVAQERACELQDLLALFSQGNLQEAS